MASMLGHDCGAPGAVNAVLLTLSIPGYLRSFKMDSVSSSNFFPHAAPGSTRSLTRNLNIDWNSLAVGDVSVLAVNGSGYLTDIRYSLTLRIQFDWKTLSRRGRGSLYAVEYTPGAIDVRPWLFEVNTELLRTLYI